MPELTEKQITELKNIGKFKEDDIELFDRYQIDYNLIKSLQNHVAESRENIGKPLEEINRQLIDFIQISARQREGFLNRYLKEMVDFLDTQRVASRSGGNKGKSKSIRKSRRKSKSRSRSRSRRKRYSKFPKE
jgi:hypothetical protein